MRVLMTGGALAAALLAPAAYAAAGASSAETCAALGKAGSIRWQGDALRIEAAAWHAAGVYSAPPAPFAGMPALPPVTLPAHCEVTGAMHERTGIDGRHYAIRIHLRLPDTWNGRFFFQGGGGTDGVLGDALGRLNAGAPPALAQGYAVLSQDSGHDTVTNSAPSRGGASAFGFDPQARADYGGRSLLAATRAALATIRRHYGKRPAYSYFVGCSKGGQEGMVLAQRYPALFDGIIASAPGFALPRAAVAEVWATQALGDVAKASGLPVTPATVASSFSPADFALVRKAVLAACDKVDGLADGIVADTRACSSERVLPELARVTCEGDKADTCLSRAQVAALVRIHDGAHDSRGHAIYAGLPWDGGWGAPGWSMWLTGNAAMHVPSINLLMGVPSLAAIFTTPPTGVDTSSGLDAALAYALTFDMDKAEARIDAVTPPFTRSAWEDISARSPDLSAFRARGGRMIVTHGASDPVFSLADTLAWWDAVNVRNGGAASRFVRVFPVPGMNHCEGGPATDNVPAFAALVGWVEHKRAPDHIVARAGAASPWPGRERPVCAWPGRSVYDGHGDPEKAASFHCR